MVIIMMNAIWLCLVLYFQVESQGNEIIVSSIQDSTWDQWIECNRQDCGRRFRCWCSHYHRGTVVSQPKCIDTAHVCDGIQDCENGVDEIDCNCYGDYQCSKCTKGIGCESPDHVPFFQCIKQSQINDGKRDCLNEADDVLREAPSKECMQMYFCDGVIECQWQAIHDEANCTDCPLEYPVRCDCNQKGNHTCKFNPALTDGSMTCYHEDYRCNGFLECSDESDELGCQCKENEFTCDCIAKRECVKKDGCISTVSAISDGFIRCPNSERKTFGPNGLIFVYQCNFTSQRSERGLPECDVSSCYVSTNLTCNLDHAGCVSSSYKICTSKCAHKPYCQNKLAFQCDNQNLIFRDHFCDGEIDCRDGSDEVSNQPGFKCNGCVLPQGNLYDDMAQCNDLSDLCFSGNIFNNNCFQCLDKRLIISSKQVCDDVNDCYDRSDECLCDDQIGNEVCAKHLETTKLKCFHNLSLNVGSKQLKLHIVGLKSTTNKTLRQVILCQTKNSKSIQATLCDGRPECKNYSDECEYCNNPAPFCNDSCHSYFPMGDRYCDGIEDSAWKYINDSACAPGFDEEQCPKRFRCQANELASIDILQVCDGKNDCNDYSDEKNCSIQFKSNQIFSSEFEMIDNSVLRFCFWFIGFVVLCGNSYVIVSMASYFKHQKCLNIKNFQHLIILNISLADLLMGVYLLTISIYSATFSGIYGTEDYKWRSSLNCSIIGSLAVISSETSCFLMFALTAFRLMNICQPIKSLTASLLPWKLLLCFAWFCSLLIGIVPMLSALNSYFVHAISFSSRFYHEKTINLGEFESFMCGFVALSNTTIKSYGDDLTTVEMFVKHSLPDSSPVGLFGYYSETCVCMPRFYVSLGDHAWEYTLSIITLNLACFLFILIAYVIIFKRTTRSAADFDNRRQNQQSKKVQRRITRIIATDFCCWIPICLMTYIRLGTNFSNIVYQISAVILLPINSALNPFLFSSLPDKLIARCRFDRLEEAFPIRRARPAQVAESKL